jgi:hypothetical protein
MQTIQDRFTLLLRAYRTIHFCDACLALKLGEFPREVREAVVLIGNGFQISSGKCSECLQEKTVVRALAAWPFHHHTRPWRKPRNRRRIRLGWTSM